MFTVFDILSLFACVVFYMFVGGVWYSPAVFGKMWVRALGQEEQDLEPSTKDWVGAAGVGLITALGMHILFARFGITSISAALQMAFWGWFAFVLPSHFSAVLWEKRPITIWLIGVVGLLVSLLGMAIILVLL